MSTRFACKTFAQTTWAPCRNVSGFGEEPFSETFPAQRASNKSKERYEEINISRFSEADDHCREYQRSPYIHPSTQSGLLASQASKDILPQFLKRKQVKWHREMAFTVFYCDYRQDIEVEVPFLPPNDADLEDGYLYAHYDGIEGDMLRVWTRASKDGRVAWRRVYSGSKHPAVADRFLSLRSGRPSWVTMLTMSRYEWESRKVSTTVKLKCSSAI